MPPRPLRVAAVRDLGPQFTDNPYRMVGQDGAYSIPLGGAGPQEADRVFWYFGDTLIGERPPGSLRDVFTHLAEIGEPEGHRPFERMPTNTGLVLPAQSGRDGLTGFVHLTDAHGEIRQLVPPGPGDRDGWDRMWCMHGIALGETVYLLYMHIRMLENKGGPFDLGFEIIGCGMAKGTVGDWQFERLHHAGEAMWWPYPQPQFASAVLQVESDDGPWLYFYGVTGYESGVQQAYLARVRPDDIEHLDRYAYLSGPEPTWSANIADAIPIFDGPPNELSVTWNAHLGSYLAVHSYNTDGKQVGRTAPHPWGPWSAPVTLWTVEGGPDKKYPVAAYAGKEHPSLSEDGGRVIYVTYIEAEEYFPHLLEVTLA
ncbi:MAG: DUF4185 domain-containing protein [Bacteroidota bacterium]